MNCETLGCPLVVGTSRKGFIGAITGETELRRPTLRHRRHGGLGAINGAAIVRVHDVGCDGREVVRMIRDDSEICRIVMPPEIRTRAVAPRGSHIVWRHSMYDMNFPNLSATSSAIAGKLPLVADRH